jgi:hypothetical protein
MKKEYQPKLTQKRDLSMKKLLLSIAIGLYAVVPSISQAEHQTTPAAQTVVDEKCQWINGYYRKDGTYVQGHYRGC